MATAADRLANNLNFGALGKATELRQRLLFTLGALIVFRLGTFLPIPGINPLALQQFFEQQSSGILGIFDTFSGGALGRMGIFALGVMPYISSSIIMTLMQSAIPYLKSLKEQGYKLAIRSNGTPNLLNDLVKTNNLENFFDDIFSIEEVGIFKPSSKVYEIPIKKYKIDINKPMPTKL